MTAPYPPLFDNEMGDLYKALLIAFVVGEQTKEQCEDIVTAIDKLIRKRIEEREELWKS